MKKFKLNTLYTEICIYFMLTVVVIILFYKLLDNLYSINISVQNFFNITTNIFSPFIFGFFIAYFLNMTLRILEIKIFKYIPLINKNKKIIRALSITLSYSIVYGLVILTIIVLIPEIIVSFSKFNTTLENNLYTITKADNFVRDNLNHLNESYNINFTYDNFIEILRNLIAYIINIIPTLLSNFIDRMINMTNFIYNFIIGTIISVYFLMDKENLSSLARRIIYSFLSKKSADLTIKTVKSSSKILEDYTYGKIIDSVFVGLLFYIVSLIFKFPYPELISIIIGTTNIIPMLGPLIGSIPVILIVLLENPSMAIWVTVAILVIQQFDGSVLSPKILGDSIGLSPIAIIFSILIGGALFKMPGMFFGPPVFAVIKNTFMYFLDINYNKNLDKYKE